MCASVGLAHVPTFSLRARRANHHVETDDAGNCNISIGTLEALQEVVGAIQKVCT